MPLEFHSLCKNYGRTQALKDFSITLDNGIYALLGPNGAGKSTLINILAGLLDATSGHITFDGEDTLAMGARFRSLIGFMPQYPGFYPDFTARQLMVYIARLKGLSQSDAKQKSAELLGEVNLSDCADKKIKSFSGGMKQRLGLAQALIGQPKILILDEPTAGLDPKERVRFRNLISRLSQQMTVIFCTHIVSDIETIATQVLLLKKGELIAHGSVGELTQTLVGKVWELSFSDSETERFLENDPCSSLVNRGGKTCIRCVSDSKPHESALPCEPCLEDVYMHTFGDENETKI